jgi:hypothetical protein
MKHDPRYLYELKQAFVYIWTNKETNRQYIGSHCGQVDDGYVSSSTCEDFWKDHEAGLLSREIILHGDNATVRFFERDLLSSRLSELKTTLYNKSAYCGKGFQVARRYYVFNSEVCHYVCRPEAFQAEHNSKIRLSACANPNKNGRFFKIAGEDYNVKYVEDVEEGIDPRSLFEPRGKPGSKPGRKRGSSTYLQSVRDSSKWPVKNVSLFERENQMYSGTLRERARRNGQIKWDGEFYFVKTK